MKFSIGLTPYSRFPDLASLQQTVRLAEGLGFYGVSIGDHAVIPASHARTLSPVWYDPLVLATAIAVSTERLHLLFNTLVLPYHHPVRLAKAIASLDVLSNGRVVVGAGVGWIEEEFQALGVPWRERGARTDEYIRAMKALWANDRAEFAGRYVQFHDVFSEPKPVQKPHPPIWIGGGVPRTLERAAALGDGWHPLGRPFEKLRDEVATLRGLLSQRGRSMDKFTLSYSLYYESVAGQTQRHMRSAGGDEASVLSGNPIEAGRQIAAFESLGFSHLTIRLRGLTYGELCHAMEAFAKNVLHDSTAKQG
ncbi:MAG: TIGR03619 family F420-dependent LLM class oxidoreductase [Chloroflexi bacterium]|nr:TIGR03619 family F420-dependent LLM class oxidoreductase [Chloroflexota bacterium]